jgi:putative inorganic carbon (HCO3(-)) transporter
MFSFARRTAFVLGFASAASILLSIAISQILLGLSIAALLLSDAKLEFPPIRLPLLLFFVDTVIALLLSANPQGGTPQIRKFFLFGIVLVICSTFTTLRQVEALIVTWAGLSSISAIWGFAQFLQRRHEALEQHADNYGFYLDQRMTGFTSHWMTFGGEEMIVALMLASYLFFSNRRPRKPYLWALLGLLLISITLGMTRCIFLLGLPLGMLYLLWRRRRWFVIVLPVAAAIGVTAAPITVRERVTSVFRPHPDLDSNAHRTVTRIVGWEMVKAHPWFGLGPEQIGKQFTEYIPPSVRRPLPNGWYGHLHNIYLQYAAERGIPGLLAVLWLIGSVLWSFWHNLKLRRVAPEARYVLHGAIAVVLAVLAEGMFEYNLGDSEVLTMFLSVIACGYVVTMHCAVLDQAGVSESVEETSVCRK